MLVWCLLLSCLLLQCSHSLRIDSVLLVESSSIGAVQPASWIRLACRHHLLLHGLSYSWSGSCNQSGAQVFHITDPEMDEKGWAVIWVRSTPLSCLDTFHCTAYQDGLEGQEVATEEFTFSSSIAGVGVSLSEDLFLSSVSNNSAVVIRQEGSAIHSQEILCQSALYKSVDRSSCVGQWLSPSKTSVGECVGQDEVGSLAFNSLRLDLNRYGQVEEGMYSCILEDENRVQQKILIGVYQNVPELKVEVSYEASPEGLTLSCIASGLPSTAISWYKDGALLPDTGDQATLTKSSSLPNGAVYQHSLQIMEGDYGMYSCEVVSTWVMADQSSSGKTSASGFFVMYPSHTTITMECAFPLDSTSAVEWSDTSPSYPVALDSVSPYTPGMGNNTAVASLKLSVDMQGHQLTCKGVDHNGHAQYKEYLLIIDGELDEGEGWMESKGGEDIESETETERDTNTKPQQQQHSVVVVAGSIVIPCLGIIVALLLSLLVAMVCVWGRKKKTTAFTAEHRTNHELDDKNSSEEKVDH